MEIFILLAIVAVGLAFVFYRKKKKEEEAERRFQEKQRIDQERADAIAEEEAAIAAEAEAARVKEEKRLADEKTRKDKAAAVLVRQGEIVALVLETMEARVANAPKIKVTDMIRGMFCEKNDIQVREAQGYDIYARGKAIKRSIVVDGEVEYINGMVAGINELPVGSLEQYEEAAKRGKYFGINQEDLTA